MKRLSLLMFAHVRFPREFGYITGSNKMEERRSGAAASRGSCVTHILVFLVTILHIAPATILDVCYGDVRLEDPLSIIYLACT